MPEDVVVGKALTLEISARWMLGLFVERLAVFSTGERLRFIATLGGAGGSFWAAMNASWVEGREMSSSREFTAAKAALNFVGSEMGA